MNLPGQVMAAPRAGWRALAVLLVLVGLPSVAVGGFKLFADWQIGPLNGSPAVLLEARRVLARLPQHDAPSAAAAAGPADEPEASLVPAARALARECSPAPVQRAAPRRPSRSGRLPDCTGPPRA